MAGFSLVEMLVVVALLSLIVLALMSVFSSTQRAFRASVTQIDVLEGGRAATELMASDLRELAPCAISGNWNVNMMVLANSVTAPAMYYSPLLQNLPGSSVQRTNLLNFFFILGKRNNVWTGTGYIVDTTSSSPLYPLYRYHKETYATNPPSTLYFDFYNMVTTYQWTNMSHLMDGVVHLTVRAYDPQGRWINEWASGYYQPYTNLASGNLMFEYPPAQGIGNGFGEAQFYMFSNAAPAALDLELGVLEDRAIARAEALGISGSAPTLVPPQWNFLQNQAGSLHLFHQRVSIPNVDLSAYQ